VEELLCLPVESGRSFDKAKSMILYLPPKYTDGFAKVSVSTPNLVPVPPASMSANTFI